MEHVTLENFEKEVIKSELPVVIDFYADWCGPCKMMAPVFESLGSEFKGKMKFLKLDTQSEEMLAMKFGVQGIPTLVFLKDGKEVGRHVGYASEDMLKGRVEEVLSKL